MRRTFVRLGENCIPGEKNFTVYILYTFSFRFCRYNEISNS